MVKRTERGWAGHFICCRACLFRRNTLLEKNGVYVVVSTVGAMLIHDTLETFGPDKYYETKAFYSKKDDTRYHDADVSKEISFDSNQAIYESDKDDVANDMHETVVAELIEKLENEITLKIQDDPVNDLNETVKNESIEKFEDSTSKAKDTYDYITNLIKKLENDTTV